LSVTMFFARHGETAHNASRTLSTAAPGPALSDTGRLQAGALLGQLREQKLTHVYSSPLVRALETAAAVSGPLSLPLYVEDDLRELSVGALEGRADDDAFAELDAVWESWTNGGQLDTTAGPGGDSGTAVLDRVRSVLRRIGGNGGRPLVISHGGLLQLALPALCHNLPADHGRVNWLRNCSVVEVTFADDLRCVEWAGVPVPSGCAVAP
jgi:broad specificity phosphatase PhoE